MRDFERQSILVTGGAGFLGAALCERLLAQGHEVLCVDNFFTGSRRHIEHLLDHPRFELMRHDVTFPLYVEVDQIYNFACPASPVHYQHDQDQRAWRDQHVGPGQARQGQDPAGFHQRGVWRSIRAPAAGKLLGPCESDRPAGLL